MHANPSPRPGSPDVNSPADSIRLHRPAPVTIADVIDKFLTHKQRAAERQDISPRTVEDYNAYLLPFRKAAGDRIVSDCNGLVLTEYLDSKSGWRSRNTVKGALARIQACFNWWAKLSDGKNPFKFVTASWGPPRKPLSQSEFDKFFAAIKSRRFAQMFMLIRLTGARPEEIYQLRRHEIRLEPPAVIVLDSHKTARKTGRNRRIPLSGPAVDILRDVLAVENGTEFAFVSRRKTPYNKDSFGHECRRICQRAGLKGVTPYRLRHSVALSAKSAGMDIRTISDFLGTSVQMLTRYYLSHSGELTEDLTRMADTVARSRLPEIPRR